MPQQLEPDFRETFASLLDPTLKGSLQVTIHGKYLKPVDPEQVSDWSLASASQLMDITFPKCYVCSTFRSSFFYLN